MSSKRKRVLLNIEEKLKICEAVKNGVPKKIIMNKYELGKSTLNDILRNENKLLTFVNEKKELGVSSAAKKTKRIRTGNYDKPRSARISESVQQMNNFLVFSTILQVHTSPF